MPRGLVDALPVDWWRPGNMHVLVGQRLHFCTDGNVRTIEWNDRVIARGHAAFPFGRWD